MLRFFKKIVKSCLTVNRKTTDPKESDLKDNELQTSTNYMKVVLDSLQADPKQQPNMQLYHNKVALVGPWGSSTGRNWSFTTKGKLTKISINHGDCINSISFTSQDENGNVFHSPKFGGSGGDHISEVNIDIVAEELNEISGTFDDRDSRMVVTSLWFSTNANSFGPFGLRRGTQFSVPLADGRFVGFYGRCSDYLHAIGFYLQAT